ncbi:acyltransferase [Candidatus Pelagibacter sp.]|nr:acyltransferase [Candidatus Pelagibacter sp.]MDA7638013.1 acyltransferase [Candidatus Pelagibacter sp.]
MNLKYRAEIDGLRAIAVTSIIFYHAKISLYGKEFFSGGFLGIDIFFVISGYLISLLILTDLDSNNNFSFKLFYEKRIRRIFPLLFIVLIFSLIPSWFILIPSDLVNFSKSSIFSIFFVSNYFFTIQDYFAFNSLLIPLLHTWSLSIEIQFYIVISILTFFLFKKLKKKISLVFFLILILSLIISSLYSQENSIGSYYYIQFRIWEFLAGSLLAIIEIKDKKRTIFDKDIFNELLLLIGIFLTLSSIYFFNNKTQHPSYVTIIPIFGTCLIIWFSKKNYFVTKILSSKPFVSIGLISYSLFLWHYPIFAFYRYSYATGNIISKLIFFSILIIISIASYFLIEKPFRNQKTIPLNFLIKFLSILFILIIFFNYLVIQNNGFEERYKFGKIYLDMNYYTEEKYKFRENKQNLDFTSDKKKILILGDSHGLDTYDALISNQNLFTKFEVVFNEVDNLDLILDTKNKNFQNKNKFYKHQLNQADIIILSYFWSQKLDKKNSELLKIFSNNLKKNNKKLLVISSPEFEVKGRFTLLDLYILKKKKLPQGLEISELQKKYYNSYISNRKLKNINLKLNNLSKFNDFIFLNLSKFLCDEKIKTCFYLTDKQEKIMFDDDHYTLAGSKFLGKKISTLNLFK